MTLRNAFLTKLVRVAAGSSLALTFGVLARADVPKPDVDVRPQQIENNANWATWRGPHRDNISPDTGLLKQWPKAGPPLAWEIKDLGGGFSSVSIANGRIYTLGSPGDQTTYLIALDSNGKKIWSSKIGQGRVDHPGPRSTPTVDGDHVYGLDEVGELACFQTSDGKEVWHVSLPKDLGGKVMSGWGFAESVLVDGDKLLCTPGGAKGTVAALDKNTGKVIWQTKDLTDPCAYASLVPCDIGGTHQYVVFTGDHVAGIGTDGSVLWSATRKGQTAVIPTPIVHDNLVFVTSGYGIGCNLFKITGSGKSFKAEQVYHNREMQVHHGGVVLVGDYVYGITDLKRGQLMCMELKTGKVVWANKCVGMKGSTAYADGMLYVRGETGSGPVALVQASPDGYHEHGRFDQPDRSNLNSWAHPVIIGGKLYLRDQNVLLCYDVKAR